MATICLSISGEPPGLREIKVGIGSGLLFAQDSSITVLEIAAVVSPLGALGTVHAGPAKLLLAVLL